MTDPASSFPIVPLRSQYADDPEMTELLGLFVGELQQRATALENAVREKQWDMVQRISHQLKGASGGYGFPKIGAAAAQVEHVVKSGPIADDESLERLTANVKELVTLCQRVRL